MYKLYFSIIVIFLNVSNLLAAHNTANSNDSVITFSITDTQSKIKINYTISISDDAFEHIMHGKLTTSTYSGGHDWKSYYDNRLKYELSPNVYYDGRMKAYIAPSEKGDSFPNIIDKLIAKTAPRYHTFFPPGVLSKEFILNALKRAFVSYHLFQKDTLDIAHQRFYVNHAGFDVAGYFTINNRDNNNVDISINTIFPDFIWQYAKEFRGASVRVEGERFAKLEAIIKKKELVGHKWIFQNLIRSELLELTPSIDQYIYPAKTEAFLGRNSSTQLYTESKNLSLFNDVENYINQKIQFSQVKINNILDLFFDNPNTPTKEELDDFEALMKNFLGNDIFRSVSNKKQTLRRRLIFAQKAVQNASQVREFVALKVSSEGHVKSFKSRAILARHIHFAHGLLDMMLLLNLASHKNALVEADLPERWGLIARNFYERFCNRLITDQALLHAMNNQGFLFAITSDNLELFAKDDVDLKKFNNSDLYVRIVATMNTPEDERSSILFVDKEINLKMER